MPPRITLGLDDQTDANLDQQVSLVCRAEGTLPLQWTWRKDGVPLRQEGGVAFTTSGSESTLIISSLVESDRGVYQCVAMQPSTGREALSNNLLNPMGTKSDRITCMYDDAYLVCVQLLIFIVTA